MAMCFKTFLIFTKVIYYNRVFIYLYHTKVPSTVQELFARCWFNKENKIYTLSTPGTH